MILLSKDISLFLLINLWLILASAYNTKQASSFFRDLRLRAVTSASHSRSDLPFQNTEAQNSLLRLSTAHFTSQALHSFVILGVADLFTACDNDSDPVTLTVDEIATLLEHKTMTVVPQDALYRILRLLTTADVVFQKRIRGADSLGLISFGLTETGRLLQHSESSNMAPFVRHWLEDPVWNSFSELPNYMKTAETSAFNAFELAHEGIAAADYYGQKSNENDISRRRRNQVAQYVSSSEIPVLIKAIDWSSCANRRIVDIGGGYGNLMAAVFESYHEHNISCTSLDLASVVDGAEAPKGVTLVAGDMFEPETIPKCDIIVTKHVLCDWSDIDVIRMLKSCHSVLPHDGQVLIIDAVLSDGPEASNQWQIQASIDVLLMLTGRQMDRSATQWKHLADLSGFRVEEIIPCPLSMSLNVTVLTKI